MKKVLVIGATGVMGRYVTEELLKLGYSVDAAAYSKRESTRENLQYYAGDFLDLRMVTDFLSGRHYDAIVDFMCYTTAQFAERYELLFEHTEHFIFLSSYRVYSDMELPTVETSPRLIDVVTEKEFLESEEYSLFKCREENIIRSSKYKNWTMVRPAITYSDRRIAFVTLEVPFMLRRARAGKPIYIPECVLDKEATLTFAGDAAKMIARLVLNEKAFCETYSVCTAEHQTWGAIADYYRELIGADIRPVPTQDYLDMFGNKNASRWHLNYDRNMMRVMDNSKILAATGMKQEELMTIRDGIARCLAEIPEDMVWTDYTYKNQLFLDDVMDEYAKNHGGEK